MEYYEESSPFTKEDFDPIQAKFSCAACCREVGLLSLARIDIQYAGQRFCSDGCLDKWLDWQQKEDKIKKKICPDCGSKQVMADGKTGLWCSQCDASYLLEG